MSEPINSIALERIRSLIALIEAVNDPEAECRIFVSNGYASVEVRSNNLPINDVRLIMGAAPLEADQVAERLEQLAAARRRALRDSDE